MMDRFTRLVMVIMLITFISLAQAQDQLPSDLNTPLLNGSICPYHQYLQYYAIHEGAVPSVHISKPTEIGISCVDSNTQYLKSEQNEIKYAQSGANITNGCSLWIQGITNCSHYVVVPLGSIVSLISIYPDGGSGVLNETNPDGSMHDLAFNFYPQSQMVFYADTIGKYILFTDIDGRVSNNIEINVVYNCKLERPASILDQNQVDYLGSSIGVPRFQILEDPSPGAIRDCKYC